MKTLLFFITALLVITPAFAGKKHVHQEKPIAIAIDGSEIYAGGWRRLNGVWYNGCFSMPFLSVGMACSISGGDGGS